MQAAAEWPELQESVAKLCATWWQADAPGREGLITQTIPYLLVRALSTCKPPQSAKQPKSSVTGQALDAEASNSLGLVLSLLDLCTYCLR